MRLRVKMQEGNSSLPAVFRDTQVLTSVLDSPHFTGTPTAPTPPVEDDSTRLATTEFVYNVCEDKAPIDSPQFSGEPTAPTPDVGDNSSKLATTDFVTRAISLAHFGYGNIVLLSVQEVTS